MILDPLQSATQMAEYKWKMLLCSFASTKESHHEQENTAPRLTVRFPIWPSSTFPLWVAMAFVFELSLPQPKPAFDVKPN